MINQDINIVATGEKHPDSFFGDYIVLRGRGGYWLRFLDNLGGLAYYKNHDPMAWRAHWVSWWSSRDDWIPVSFETCLKCDHHTPLCLYCRAEARHFLDWDELRTDVYFCDECRDRFYPVEEALWEQGVEIGAYACCDNCTCDSWR